MKKLVMSLAAVAALSSSAFAGGNNQTGCGLGSQILPNADSALMHAFQATTNGTSGNQTFGITSGTSGCTQSSIVLNDQAQDFVATNMDVLAQEIAMGQGESLDTLAELLKVEDKAVFASALQAKFSKIYTSENVQMADVLNAIATI